MRLLAICGSPRESGNTRRYLELALKEAQTLGAETELVWLGDKTIHGCKGCYGCVQARRCVIEDDFQPILAQMAGQTAFSWARPPIMLPFPVNSRPCWTGRVSPAAGRATR